MMAASIARRLKEAEACSNDWKFRDSPYC